MKKFVNIFQQNRKFNLLALKDLVDEGDVIFLEKEEVKKTYPDKVIETSKEKFQVDILNGLGYTVIIENNYNNTSICVLNCNTETYSVYRRDKLSEKNLEIFDEVVKLLREPKNNKYNKFNILIPLFKNIKLDEIRNETKEVEGKRIITKEYAVIEDCSLGSLYLTVDITEDKSILHLNLFSHDSEGNEWIINLFDGTKCPKINDKLVKLVRESNKKQVVPVAS